MSTVRVNGVELYFESRGEGAPILGIHGTPSSALLWEDAAAVLARYGRCVTYDRRGFGRSQRPFQTTDLSDHVQDATALLDALTAEPAVVIGRSTGGLIAAELAVVPGGHLIDPAHPAVVQFVRGVLDRP